jgi:hypothetical protein
MKRLLLLLAVVCTTLSAQSQAKSLFITFNDGSKAEFAMADNPAITMTDGTMTIVTAGNTLDYELWRVKQFTFGTSTGIQEISSPAGILVSDRPVSIYTLDGKAVSVPMVQGKAHLDLLPSGLYIININGNTLKYMKP